MGDNVVIETDLATVQQEVNFPAGPTNSKSKSIKACKSIKLTGFLHFITCFN